MLIWLACGLILKVSERKTQHIFNTNKICQSAVPPDYRAASFPSTLPKASFNLMTLCILCNRVSILTLLCWHFCFKQHMHIHTCVTLKTEMGCWALSPCASSRSSCPSPSKSVTVPPVQNRQRAFTALTYITTSLWCLSDSCVSLNLIRNRDVAEVSHIHFRFWHFETKTEENVVKCRLFWV